jgi:hypothetical protein
MPYRTDTISLRHPWENIEQVLKCLSLNTNPLSLIKLKIDKEFMGLYL